MLRGEEESCSRRVNSFSDLRRTATCVRNASQNSSVDTTSGSNASINSTTDAINGGKPGLLHQ